MPKYKENQIIKTRFGLWMIKRVSCWRPCRECDFRDLCRQSKLLDYFGDYSCSKLLGFHQVDKKDTYMVFKKLEGGI